MSAMQTIEKTNETEAAIAEFRQYAADVAVMCNARHRPELAAKFIRENKPLVDVLAALDAVAPHRG